MLHLSYTDTISTLPEKKGGLLRKLPCVFLDSEESGHLLANSGHRPFAKDNFLLGSPV